jgi:hypothetical protein
VRLRLRAPDGSSAYDQTLAMDASPRDSVTIVQTPLYSAPNKPLTPGTYQLIAGTQDGAA